MKKNRAYSRQLKREIKELRRKNECHEHVIEAVKCYLSDNKVKYEALCERIRLFAHEFTVCESDMYHLQKAGLNIHTQLIDSMMRHLMQNGEFRAMFHVERMDNDYRHPEINLRYKVTLEALKSAFTKDDYNNLMK